MFRHVMLRRWAALMFLGAALAGTTSCARAPARQSRDGGTARQAALQVKRGDFESRLILTGELEASRGELISVPPVPTWQIAVKWIESDGAEVRKGQRIAELDNTPFAGSLREKEAAEVQARHDLAMEEAKRQADLSDKEFDVEKRRLELERARVEASIPETLRAQREHQEKQLELERSAVEFEKAKAELAALRHSSAADVANRRLALEKAQREIQTAREAIATTTLRAPRDGILTVADHLWEGRKIQAGDSVWVGFRIATLPDLSSLQVIANLVDVDDRKVRAGQSAVVVLDTFSDRPVKARVVEVSPVAQEVSPQSLRRAFRVLARLEQVDTERMRPGYSVRLIVLSEKRSNVLLAPRAALDLSKTPPRARLLGGRTVAVRVGPCDAQQCIVEEGLPEKAALEPVQGAEDLAG